MGKTKRYFWLKLKEDFFSDDTIEWIEEQKNGKEYCLFYLKLCLKAIRSNGVLIRRVGDILIPYDANKLAELTRTDYDTVVVAMQLFKQIGLVQILENGEIFLSQLSEMVGSETDKAALMRKARANKALGNIVTSALPERYTDIDIEKEKDKELEKEIDKEQDKEKGKKPRRKKYGEYANVLLSDEEYAKLQKEFPEDYAERIENLSEYIGKFGNKYKNHLAVIRSWARKDRQAQQQTRPADYSKLPTGELPY